MFQSFIAIVMLLSVCLTDASKIVRNERQVDEGSITTLVNDEDLLVGDTLSQVETFEDFAVNYTLSCKDILQVMQRKSNGSFPLEEYSKIKVKLRINDTTVATIDQSNESSIELELDCKNDSYEMIRVVAGHLGITRMTVKVVANGNSFSEIEDIQIRVKRQMTLFDELTFFILGPLILLNKCAFGAKIEIDTLKHIFTQPVALLLCLFMQFVGMPFLALLYSMLFKLSQSLALALFVAATCPGGGGGYVISYLVGGDVTLAISASLLSTMVAMAAMPAVIGSYAYFSHIPDNIAIPYVKMVLILCAIAIPISTGMLINRKWPEFAKKLVKIIQPLSLFLIFCGFTFLAVSSKYIIDGPAVGWALAFILPTSGFVLSILFARCVGLSWPFAKAISLESGMKNTVLGIAVIELTYPQPEADLSSILIIMVTLGHTSLAMLWYFGYLIKKRCCTRSEKNLEFMKLEPLDSDEEDEETTEFVALNR